MKQTLAIGIICLLVGVGLIYAKDGTSGLAPTTSEKTVTLNFAGDILAARAVEITMRKQGYDYPFRKIQSELADADITFANLETPLIGTATSGKTTPGGTTVFRGDIAFAKALKDAGIDVLSLANNHMKDQGEKGIASTLKALDEAGLVHTGAGINLEEARRLKVVEIQAGEVPVKVGYLSYNDSDVVPPSYHAGEKQSGTNIMNIERLKADILASRAQADILVVSMHSGTEYVTSQANTRQTSFARAAIDAGADLVIGHHPHVLQPMELYKGKYIFYSLGNFVFDQPWPDTKESALIHMSVDLKKSEGKWNILTFRPQILPLILQNFQPQRTANEAKNEQILNRFSRARNTLTFGQQTIFAEMATSAEARTLGLSNRKKLPQDTGLLFVFDAPGRHGFWMKDMRFPIDIFWFDESFRLVDKRLSADPSSYPNVFYPLANAKYVLETNVGVLDSVSLTRDLTGELTLLQSYDKR